MLKISYKDAFLSRISKVKDETFKERIKKLVNKIITNPEIGKPMQYECKGTREVYASPFRVSYAYVKEEEQLIFLDIYHKRKQ